VTATGRSGPGWGEGEQSVQTTRPRDLGMLALVIGLLLTLFVLSALLGSPAIQ
jgi:hypothetical protein